VPATPDVGVRLAIFGGATIVYVAVATALSFIPAAYAMAFMVVVLFTAIGPLYNVPVVSLGVDPSVV
jgi:type IV secretory pathway VirB6-like protein